MDQGITSGAILKNKLLHQYFSLKKGLKPCIFHPDFCSFFVLKPLYVAVKPYFLLSGTRSNSFNFCDSKSTPSIRRVLSDIPIALVPPSVFANTTMEIANAFGSIFILYRSKSEFLPVAISHQYSTYCTSLP